MTRYCSGSPSEFYLSVLGSSFDEIDLLVSAKSTLAVFDEDILFDRTAVKIKRLNLVEFNEKVSVWLLELTQCCYFRMKSIGHLEYNWSEEIFEYFKENTGNIGEVAIDRSTTNFSLDSLNSSVKQSKDYVVGIRCLDLPVQASQWFTRKRKYDWPTKETIYEVKRVGCDVLHVLRDRNIVCDSIQWRISFLRAETILMNSWMPIQQIVYKLLQYRIGVEMSSGAWTPEDMDLLNQQIKTLMFWECERKPYEWWNENCCLDLYSDLLREFQLWFEKKFCPDYFMEGNNLFNQGMDRNKYMRFFKKINSYDDILMTLEYYLNVKNHLKANLEEPTRCMLSDKQISNLHKSFVQFEHDQRQSENSKIYPMPQKQFLKKQLSRRINDMLEESRRTEKNANLFEVSLNFNRHPSVEEYGEILFTSSSVVFLEWSRNKFNVRSAFDPPYPYCSKWYFLNGRELLATFDDSKGSEFNSFSLAMCGEFFRCSLQIKDEFSESIHNRSRIYLAAIEFERKGFESSWKHCALTISSIKIARKTELQTLDIPSLLFIDDVSSVIGFTYLIDYLQAGRNIEVKRTPQKQIQTSLEFFAHYLAFTSQTFHLRMTKQDFTNSLKMRATFCWETLLVQISSHKWKTFFGRLTDNNHDKRSVWRTNEIKYTTMERISETGNKPSTEGNEEFQITRRYTGEESSSFGALDRYGQYDRVSNFRKLILQLEIKPKRTYTLTFEYRGTISHDFVQLINLVKKFIVFLVGLIQMVKKSSNEEKGEDFESVHTRDSQQFSSSMTKTTMTSIYDKLKIIMKHALESTKSSLLFLFWKECSLIESVLLHYLRLMALDDHRLKSGQKRSWKKITNKHSLVNDEEMKIISMEY